MSFTCPTCARTSENPNDEREGYCGACHDWAKAEAEFGGSNVPAGPLPGWDDINGLHYDRDGAPCSMRTWLRLSRDHVVADDTIGPYRISTVYLGLAINDSGDPEIFETMIFVDPEREVPLFPDEDQYRWTTEQAALEGHQSLVTLAGAMLAEPAPQSRKQQS